jgi:L-histidine N-alpha-methyltransferase
MRTPRFLQLHSLNDHALADEAAAGLRASPATVSPKFFYDLLGSRLFDAITALDEYYPTRTEASIFDAHGQSICDAVLQRTAAAPALIDLGAGNCAKAARLFDRFAPRRYVAIDVSVQFLRQSMEALQRAFPELDMVGVGMDLSTRLQLPDELLDGPALLFFPGSSIGNFGPDAALQLLRQARAAAGGGALLIGADLLKPKAILEAAYDDELGVTAAFNLNLLRHLNRLLGADFDVRGWRHVARFDAQASRIQMHLQARDAITVRWRGGERRFASGERIHTENSYKWTVEGFAALLRQAGFGDPQCWTDPQGWFGVFVAAA